MRDLNDVQCFVKAAELKTLTAAAKALRLPTSSVSRKIKSLEQELGMTLMTRTTRALNLTEAGRRYYEKAAFALQELATAETALDESRHGVEGTVRITAPVEFSSGPFNQLVRAFVGAHPRVRVDLLFTNRMVDLVAEGVDFAFRIGPLADSSLIAKRIALVGSQIVAAPAYLKAHGTPRMPDDLRGHACIAFAPAGAPLAWSLSGPGGATARVQPAGPVIVNHLQSLAELAVAGLGLALLPSMLSRAPIEAKQLRVACDGWTSHEVPLHLVYPSQAFVSPKLRAFIELAGTLTL